MNQIIVLIVSVLLWAQVLANEPRILMIHQALGTWRGVETDLLVRHKKFCDNNVVSHLIVPKISQMIPYLVEAKLPFVVSEDLKLVRCPKGYREEVDSLYAAMVKAVQYYALNVIFCTSFEQLEAAQRVKKQLPVKIIYIEHTFLHAIPHYFLEGRDQNLKNIDGMICVCQQSAELIKAKNTEMGLGIKNIAVIICFIDDERLLKYVPTKERQTYFKEAFNLDVGNQPVVSMIGNFYLPAWLKRHDLLLEAVSKLKREHQLEIQVMLAGHGPGQADIEKMADTMGLRNNVHFLGFVADTASLLYHSDFHVLSSGVESVGIATLEAGFMKKPAIVATGTGADGVLLHEQTGLFFRNGDSNDLANKMLLLLTEPVIRQALGQTAYTYNGTHFAADVLFAQTYEYFQNVCQT
jgi:glycosyltransferase involved in cell wall biosynthesis